MIYCKAINIKDCRTSEQPIRLLSQEMQQIESDFKTYQTNYEVMLKKIHDYKHYDEGNILREFFEPFFGLFLFCPNIPKSNEDKYELFKLDYRLGIRSQRYWYQMNRE